MKDIVVDAYAKKYEWICSENDGRPRTLHYTKYAGAIHLIVASCSFKMKTNTKKRKSN